MSHSSAPLPSVITRAPLSATLLHAHAHAQRAPWWMPWWLALLMIVCAVPFASAPLILDVVRDLIAAHAITAGGPLPMSGPVFNAMLHLGPVWYYVLALPLLVTDKVWIALLFVGALAALKFPLAYLCGRRLIDWRLGAAWAAMLALPGWSLASAIIVTHTAIVEASLLLVLWFALRLGQGGGRANWLSLGLACGIALHAHPATLVLAPLLVFVWVRRRGQWRGDLPWIAAAGLAFLSLLLPMLLAEWRAGWPAFAAVGDYARSRVGAQTEPVWPFLRGISVGGFSLASEYLAQGSLVFALRAAWIVVLSLSVAGLLRALFVRRAQPVALAMLAAFTLTAVGLYLLRPVTPFYMALVAVPALTGALAVGAWAWRSRFVFVAILTTATLLGASAATLLTQAEGDGLVRLPVAGIGNVRVHVNPVEADHIAMLPAWQLDRFAIEACASGTGKVMHGEIGSLIEKSLLLPAEWRCDGAARVRVGGGAGERMADHRLGLTPGIARVLGLPGASGWSESVALRPKRVIAGQGSNALARGDRYPFRERFTQAAAPHLWRFRTDADDTVLITSLFEDYDGARTLAVRANGKPQQPVFQTNALDAWRCSACAAPVDWTVEIATPDPERVDIVVAE